MGQCLSGGSGPDPAERVPVQPVPRPCGVERARTCLDTESATGNGLLQIVVHAAAWRAFVDERTRWQVHEHGRQVLLALFHGRGEYGALVSRLLNDQVVKLYAQRQESARGIPDALKSTMAALEDLAVCSPSLPAQARQQSGAAALLAVVDLDACVLHVASVGDALCTLCRTTGAFNARQPDAELLASGDAVTMNGHSERALGFAALKNGGGPAVDDSAPSAMPILASKNLSSRDESLVLATGPYWDLASPSATALRAHFHERRVCLDQEAERAGLLNGSGGVMLGGIDNGTALPPLAVHNAAAQLVTAAMADLSDRQGSGLTVVDLGTLPYDRYRGREAATLMEKLPSADGKFGRRASVDIAVTTASPSSNGGSTSASDNPLKPRSAMHGDVAVLAVTLRWHAARSAGEAAARKVLAARRDAALPPRARRARALWTALRCHVDCLRAARRWHLRALRAAVDAAYAAAAVRARALQERAYVQHGRAVDVSPGLKVRDAATGEEVDAAVMGIHVGLS